MIVLRICEISPLRRRATGIERPHDLSSTARAWRGVREDEDRAVAQDFVRQLIHRHDLVECELERDEVEPAPLPVDPALPVVADFDPADASDRAQDVLDADVVEAEVQRLRAMPG